MYYENFERLCKEKEVRPSQVSKATGISTATLTSWKQGKYTPKNDKLQKIADYFEVPLTEIIGSKINFNVSDLFAGVGAYKETTEPNKKKTKHIQVYRPVPEYEQPFYYDENTLELVDFLKDNQEYSVLFDTYRDVPKEEIQKVVEMIKLMLRK